MNVILSEAKNLVNSGCAQQKQILRCAQDDQRKVDSTR